MNQPLEFALTLLAILCSFACLHWLSTSIMRAGFEWRRLEDAYAVGDTPADVTFVEATWANVDRFTTNALKIGYCGSGMLMRIRWPTGIRSKPILIPWDRIRFGDSSINVLLDDHNLSVEFVMDADIVKRLCKYREERGQRGQAVAL